MYETQQLAAADRQRRVLAQVAAFAAAAHEREVIAVSNEVGSGVVPENALAREFRDLQGITNQKLSAAADRVVLIIAGLPLVLKN